MNSSDLLRRLPSGASKPVFENSLFPHEENSTIDSCTCPNIVYNGLTFMIPSYPFCHVYLNVHAEV